MSEEIMEITPLFHGIFLVTGEHGTGKTSFALETGDIAKTVFVDHDVKGRQTYQQMQADGLAVAGYYDMVDRCAGLKGLDVHKRGLEVIAEIANIGGVETLVWDNWTLFAESCVEYVKAYPEKFRDDWAAMGKIRKGEEYKEARLYEAELLAKLQSRVPTVVITSHLKNQYLNNVPTGKNIPAVSKAIDRICLMRLWLRHNPRHTTPIGLVLKNIDKKVTTAHGRVRTMQMLPHKLTPLESEYSLWETIERYYADPIGVRKPMLEETPDDFELSIIKGTLTEDQKISWLYAMQAAEKEAEENALMELEGKRNDVLRLDGEGLSKVKISQQLEIPVKDVIRILKESESNDEEGV